MWQTGKQLCPKFTAQMLKPVKMVGVEGGEGTGDCLHANGQTYGP